jgi:hypothetical protein
MNESLAQPPIDPDILELKEAKSHIDSITEHVEATKNAFLEFINRRLEFERRNAAVSAAYHVARAMAKTSSIRWHDIEFAISLLYFERRLIAALKEMFKGIEKDVTLLKVVQAQALTTAQAAPCIVPDADHVAFYCLLEVLYGSNPIQISCVFSIYFTCCLAMPTLKLGAPIQIRGLPASASGNLETLQQSCTKDWKTAVADKFQTLLGSSSLNALGIPQTTYLTAFSTNSALHLVGTFQEVIAINPDLDPTDPSLPAYYRKRLKGVHVKSGPAAAPPLPGTIALTPLHLVDAIPIGTDITVKIRVAVVLNNIRDRISDQARQEAASQDVSFDGVSGPEVFPVQSPSAGVGGKLKYIVHVSKSFLFIDFSEALPVWVTFLPGPQLTLQVDALVVTHVGIYDWHIQVDKDWQQQIIPLPIADALWVDPALMGDALYLHLSLP